MKEEYKSLFTPWKIGNLEIKNRIVLCPMGGTSLFGWMKPSSFNKINADFFLEVAKNNVGLVIPGIAPIRDMIGRRWLYKNEKMYEDLKTYMEEFHKTGAKLFVQLTAGFGRSFSITKALELLHENKVLGTLAKPIIDAKYLTASPSELPCRWDDKVKCRALTIEEIHEMIEAFGLTAKKLKDAGVDGVEVHAVHEGYLLDQFATKYTNFRKDEYGGSLENRLRFAVEICKSIKKACGDDFPVSVRYSVVSKTKGFDSGALPEEGDSYVEVGRDFEESKQVVKILEEAGYDMLNCDNGTYDAWYWAHPPVYMPNNCNLKDVEAIKPYTKLPVVCAGKMELSAGSEAVKENKIDAVGVARQFLADPDWVTKVIEGKEEDILPCIRCHNYCFAMAHYKGVPNDESMADLNHMSRCALNPSTRTGDSYKIKPTDAPKSIAIIGGGIGGMEVARVASLRGHKCTIFEKTNRLGGVFNEAANFDFKEADKLLLKWYEHQMKNLDVEIKFNQEIKDVRDLVQYDKIVVASGAVAKILPVKGSERCLEAVSYLKDKDVLKDKKKIIVIGGGLTGCEIAYDLSLKGKEVVIIEALQDLMVGRGLPFANTSYLRDYFKLHKTEVHLNAKVVEITDKEVVFIDEKQNRVSVSYDSVISSIGYKPAPTFEKGNNISVIGDASKVGNLRNVIWGAYELGLRL